MGRIRHLRAGPRPLEVRGEAADVRVSCRRIVPALDIQQQRDGQPGHRVHPPCERAEVSGRFVDHERGYPEAFAGRPEQLLVDGTGPAPVNGAHVRAGLHEVGTIWPVVR